MRLSHVTLFVSDIPRARAFYEALGFQAIVLEDHYCRFLTAADATLSIERAAGPLIPCAQIGIEFESAAGLDAYVDGLKAKGVAVAQDCVDRSWLWRDAKVRDPDGHELMLFYAGGNKLNPPWRVNR